MDEYVMYRNLTYQS